jgi:hypothetical protein
VCIGFNELQVNVMNTDQAKTPNGSVSDKAAMSASENTAENTSEEKSAVAIGSEACEKQVSDSQLTDAIRLQLDQSCAALDGYTLSRLHKIRSTALASRHQGYRRYLWSWGSLMTACLLVVTMGTNWLNFGASNGASNRGEAAPPLEDVELLAANEAIDLYQDYEFYQWLASNE